MKTNGRLLGIIIAGLLGVLLFKQQKLIDRFAGFESATSQSFSTLTNAIQTTEERLARESASQHASLSASLAEMKPSPPAETKARVESGLSMKVICNTGEPIELKNIQLISNGKPGDALNLRADSLAFWLQIPWSKISKVTVRKSGTDTRPMGVVTLLDGTTHEHLIHSSDIRGQSDLGQMQIAIPDVREMVNVIETGKR